MSFYHVRDIPLGVRFSLVIFSYIQCAICRRIRLWQHHALLLPVLFLSAASRTSTGAPPPVRGILISHVEHVRVKDEHQCTSANTCTHSRHLSFEFIHPFGIGGQ